VARIKKRIGIDVVWFESEVSGVRQNAQAICVDQPFEGSRISLAAAAEEGPLQFSMHLS